jgi:hypothetical protein
MEQGASLEGMCKRLDGSVSAPGVKPGEAKTEAKAGETKSPEAKPGLGTPATGSVFAKTS